MIAGGNQIMLVAGAAWLVMAVAATLAGVRRAGTAARESAQSQIVAGLLAAAPAVPVLIYPDGAVDADPRVGDWLGLDETPRTMADLALGFADGELARIEQLCLDALDSGSSFESRARLVVTGRTLLIRAAPYDQAGLPSRAVLAWFSDVSAFEHETGRLRDETTRLGGALDGLSVLIEAAPFPIWHRGPDLDLALVNQAYVRAVEAEDAGDVVARGLELVEPGSDGTARAIASTTRERGTVTTRLAPAIVAGQRRMMRVVDVPIGSAGVAGFAMDVQELEDARADLSQLARAQRDMLDRLSAGVAQFGGDHGLTFFNRHFQRMFALQPEWLSDRPEFDNVLDRMREAQRAPESRDFRTWRDERRGWFQVTEPVEETWLLPTGTHLRVVAQPMPDGGLLLIFEDRTEHLQLASARDTLLRVRTATFDNLFEAVGVFAQDGRLQLWNTRFGEVWHLEETELSSHPRVDAFVQMVAAKLVDPAQAQAIRDLVRVATVDRQQRGGRIAMKDGHHYQFAAVPLPDGNALFTLVDVTASRGIEEALRERNAALEEANRIRADFVASMSHELRDPLTAITGYAEMLAGGYGGVLPPLAREYAAAIITGVERLGGLIGDALDLSQSKAGTLPLAAAHVDVDALAREAAELAEDPALAAGLSLITRIGPDAGRVIGDERRLAQCLDHLLRNAVAYTPSGGRITLRARSLGRVAEIAVSDTGPGIAAEKLAAIFDRIARPKAEPEDEVADKERRGIGLPLARQLIEAHGGTLELTSEIGRGTTAAIRLPLAPPEG